MTSSTPKLIGLEELQPEPCDETGDDAMSNRFRRKWHIVGTTNGGHVGSQTTGDAERRAADDAAFGEWLYHQCHDSPDARRLFAKWQQREELAKRDVLPKETLLDVLNFFIRVELDNWSTVSRKFYGSIERAQPLRPVFSAVLTCYCTTGWTEKPYEAVFYVKNDGRAAKYFNAPDVGSLFTPFFGCLRFCCLESGIHLQNIPIGSAFVDDLKAVNKGFHIAAEFNTCQMYQVTFAEDVDPYDVITSFPSFRRISTPTLASLVKHLGRVVDALLRSLATHGIWNVCIPDEKEKWGGWAEVLQQVDGSHITEDGVLDFAFADYEDDEEGRALKVSLGVPLSLEFFEKLVKACRGCKNTRKTEVIVATHRDFDIAEWKPKMIPRLDNYWRDYYAHRPVWEFHFDDLTVRYVRADPRAYSEQAARIHFWRNGAPTLSDHVLYTGPRP